MHLTSPDFDGMPIYQKWHSMLASMSSLHVLELYGGVIEGSWASATAVELPCLQTLRIGPNTACIIDTIYASSLEVLALDDLEDEDYEGFLEALTHAVTSNF